MSGIKWFHITKNIQQPKKRYLYAVKTGDYAGNFIAYIDRTKVNYSFLTIPPMEQISVPIDDFKQGIENKILDFVEILPKNVYKIIEAEYFTKGPNLKQFNE